MRPLRQRIAVDHWVLENIFSVADEVWNVEPVKMPVCEFLQKILKLATAVPILPIPKVVRRKGEIGNPIDQGLAI